MKFIQHQRHGVANQNHYDKWQFSDKGTHPVEAHYMGAEAGWVSNGVAFEDYARMNVRMRRSSNERRLPTPVWAVNDKMLRELLVVFMEERAGIKSKWPKCKTKPELKRRLSEAQNVITLKLWPDKSRVLTKLCREYVAVNAAGATGGMTDTEVLTVATQVFGHTPLFVDHPTYGAKQMLTRKRRHDLEMQIENIDTYLRIHRGGGTDVVAAVVYLYYRAGMDSVGVGAELGLKPPHVRTTLFRLHETWDAWHPQQAGDTVGVTNKDGETNPKAGVVQGAGFVTHNMFDNAPSTT